MSGRLRRILRRTTLALSAFVTVAILFLALGGERLFTHEVPSDGVQRLDSGSYARLPRYRWAEARETLSVPESAEGPTIDPRTGDLIFAQRSQKAGLELHRARKSARGFAPAEVLLELSSGHDELDPCFDGTGEALWFASNRPGQGGFDLYRAERRGDGFAAPTRLGLSSESDDRHPALSEDADVAVFASSRLSEDGVRNDLFMARSTAGTFGEAVPLLSLSAPRADQRSPEFWPGGKALVFASDRTPSRGGYDLWISRLGEGSFQPPERFDGLSSVSDDLDPAFSSGGRFAYLARGTAGARTSLVVSERLDVFLLDVTGANAWTKLLKPLLAILLGLLVSYLALSWDRLHPFAKFVILSLIIHLLILLMVKPRPPLVRPGGDLEAIAVAWLGSEEGGESEAEAQGDQVAAPRAATELSAKRPTQAPSPLSEAEEAIPERAPVLVSRPRVADLEASAAPVPELARSEPAEVTPRKAALDPSVSASAEAPTADASSSATRRRESLRTLGAGTPRALDLPSASDLAVAVPLRGDVPAGAPTAANVEAARPRPVALPTVESGAATGQASRREGQDAQVSAIASGPRSTAEKESFSARHLSLRAPRDIGTLLPASPGQDVPLREPSVGGQRPPLADETLVAARPDPTRTARPASGSVEPGARRRSDPASTSVPGASSGLEGPRDLVLERRQTTRLTRQVPALASASTPGEGIDLPERAVASADPTSRGSPASVYAQRSGPGKLDAVQRGGGSAQTEAAVLAGLRYLQAKQRKSGAFGPRTTHGKYGDFRIGKSGLALLAFLGAGATHMSEGEFRGTVQAALEFLVSTQDRRTGHFGDGEAYGHGIVTYAIAEAFAMTKDENLRAPLVAAVDRIRRAQVTTGRAKLRGGWSYFYRDEHRAFDPWPRLSISAWQIMALESARMSGLEVPQETLAAAKRYVMACYDEDLAAFRYNHDPQWLRGSYPTLPGSNGAALFALQILGVPRDDPLVLAAQTYVQERRPADQWRRFSDEEFARQGLNNLYYLYYATLGMFVLGGEPWEAWNREMSALLVRGQSKDGSWKPVGYYAEFSGDTDQERLYTTAFAVLTLEVYYRYVTPLLMQAAAR